LVNTIFRAIRKSRRFSSLLRTPWQARAAAARPKSAGRAELLQTPFSKFERNIRDQLGRMLGGAGFDAAKDIEGITVNRWAHGYAFAPNPLFDPVWKEEEKPGSSAGSRSAGSPSPTPMPAQAPTRMWPSIRPGAPSANFGAASCMRGLKMSMRPFTAKCVTVV